MNFAIYSPATGHIRAVCHCQSPDQLSHMTGTCGDVAIECDGGVEPLTHFVADGVITPYTPDQAAVRSHLPYPTAVWSNTSFSWSDLRTMADLWAEIRAQRSALLSSSDWTQLPDVPDATQLQWSAFRQALRDITTQPNPRAIQWPASPI